MLGYIVVLKNYFVQFKQRLSDNFGHKVNLELQTTSRVKFYLFYDCLKYDTNHLDIVKTLLNMRGSQILKIDRNWTKIPWKPPAPPFLKTLHYTNQAF